MMTRRSVLQAAVLQSDIVAVGSQTSAVSRSGKPDFARRIFSRINELRQMRGASALQWSDAVAECAAQQSALNPEYTDTSVGLAQGSDGAWFVTQIFLETPAARPRIWRRNYGNNLLHSHRSCYRGAGVTGWPSRFLALSSICF